MIDNGNPFEKGTPEWHARQNEITIEGFAKRGREIRTGIKEESTVHLFTPPARTGKAAELAKGWQQRLEEHVIEFNKKHALVIIGGTTRVMRKTYLDDREGFEFLKILEINGLYANTKIQIGVKDNKYGDEKLPIYANHFKAWHTHHLSDVYRNGVVFRPNYIMPDGYLNTWQGFAIKPEVIKAWDLIRAHIDGIICQHKPEMIKYFYSWIAYTLQRPEKPVGSAIILRGKKGCGKGIIGHFLRRLWGQHGLYISQAEQLTGKFNGHLADACFVFADEAFFVGDRKHESTLKALVTDPVIMIERKGLEAIQQQNYIKLFMATNEDYAVNASVDERRWCVLDVSDSLTGNHTYFKSLRSQCENSAVMATFLFDMLKYDLTGWNASSLPESDGLKHQRQSSMKTPALWLMDCLHSGSFNKYEWEDKVEFSELKNSYLAWCDAHKINCHSIATDNSLGRYLGKIFDRDRLGVQRVLFYILGNLDEAIKKFNEHEGVEVD